MKSYLLFSFRLALMLGSYLLFCSFPGCSITDEHIQNELKKMRDDCSMPAEECDGVLGSGLLCGITTFKDGTPCERYKSMTDKFDINIVGFFSFNGKGSGTLSFTSRPVFAEHNHFAPNSQGGACAEEYIKAQYFYEEKADFRTDGGVDIIKLVNGDYVSEVSKVVNKGARCKKEKHPEPRACIN